MVSDKYLYPERSAFATEQGVAKGAVPKGTANPRRIMRIHMATGNRHKSSEVADMFKGEGLAIEVIAAHLDGGMPQVEETADTFVGNARLKARALHRALPRGAWVLADDSGLVVDRLGGKPGVRSARFAGENATFEENNRKLLEQLRDVRGEGRSARFVCSLILIEPDGREHNFVGLCEGVIAEAPSGRLGFGYDPLFLPRGYNDTFAALGLEQKNRLSHRAMAVAELTGWLRSRLRG